jgi:hypothetical protein
MCSKLSNKPKCGKCGRGIKQKIVDLNVFKIMVWGTLRSNVGRKMVEGQLLLQIIWKC